MNLWQAECAGVFLPILESPHCLLPALLMGATLSQLAILKKHGLRLKKSLGQHILADANIARKIVDALDLGPDEGVVEIGAGLGALTTELSSRAGRVIAIEIDGRLASALREETNGNVDILEANFLALDFGKLLAKYPDIKTWKVVGNLPYYITTNILLHLIDAREHFKTAVITVQDEFAKRIVAGPGTKDYSSLSILIRYRFEPEIMFQVKQTSFFPRPDVRSSVVRLSVLERPGVDVREEGLFFQTIRAAFGQRRKTLRRSLRQIPGLTPETIEVVSRMSGVGSDRRPEDLSIEEFASLANAVKDVVG
ncbi:MAG: 16S rRNA (adenine(1518)-N(6)/adenine(1519)-N(6))-dimethyltransferase RsmA [bacterium]